jgi:hypothetical protein
MVRKVLVLLVVFGLCICNVTAEQISSEWVGGEWGFWENKYNWDPPIVPENSEPNTFAVTIDASVVDIDILVREDHTIDRLDTYGEVNIARHNWEYDPELKLVEPNGLTNHGYLEIEDEIEIQGNVFNTSGAWLNGWFDIEGGDLVNEAKAWIDATDNHIDVHDGSIYNYGSIVATPAAGPWAASEFHNFGEIENYGGMCSSDQPFTNEMTGEIKGFGLVHSDQVINNEGNIQSIGGDLLLHSRVDFEGPYLENRGLTNTGTLMNSPGTSLAVMVWLADVRNEGTIEINSDGSVVFDCNDLTNEPNAVINLNGGTLSAGIVVQAAGATFEGFGGITGDVQIEADGLIELTGPTNVFGNVTIGDGATLEVSDGTTIITGHTTCNNGTIHMIGGRVICQGGLANNGCEIVWEPGIDSNAADYNLDGRVNLEDYAQFTRTWLWESSWR